ncbi:MULTISPECIES: hypothetical protein [Stenotrophomonas]|uniref:Uncharacterized protein n=1 Tax=Stenotrophomonas lactitubi TaxID=2045214 RepID=A0ABS2V8M2_9GAMM|nr:MULTISPECIES: hypothetical protein [Stenotrophomonas]MBM9937938.1 hypothetical protein [Stenotrophomonas lactitubi]NYT99999.1 hypothetical protein [Stenotrophomonas sp. SbOxS2]
MNETKRRLIFLFGCVLRRCQMNNGALSTTFSGEFRCSRISSLKAVFPGISAGPEGAG